MLWRSLLLKLFFVTGATALGYQLVWTRMLANNLGHEMRAVLAIVTTFMGGMAVGSWCLGKLIRRAVNPGRWYAGLEIFIGFWAIIVTPRTPWLLLPATIAMGATFVAMERFIRPFACGEEFIRPRAWQGRYVAAMYAVNTIGAVAGILAVTWWLMPEQGLRATAIILGVVNVSIGIIAWIVSRPVTTPDADIWRADLRLMATVAVTGLLAIGFEIVGVRVLAQVMENTVYSFAAALAVYLLGTSFGAALYHRLGGEHLLNDLLAATPVVCLGSVFMLSKAQVIYNGLRSAFGNSGMGVMAAEMVLALCVFLLPTMMMGAIFSLLMQRQPVQLPRLLALNTFGAALAPVLFGVLLLPAIGSKWALVMISVGYFALITRWRWLMPGVAVGMVLLLPKLQFVQVPAGGAIVDHREGVMASVAVVRDARGDRTLKVNNRFQMGGTSAANTEYRQAHFPLKLHGQPQRALFLGTGTGITFGAATLYPNLEADGVELLPEVVDVMHHFKPENFLDQYGNRLRMHVADARRFVKTTCNAYDVIVADLFHPSRDGAGTLYTKEHFTTIRGRLKPGGIFCQWLPLHQMDETMLRIVIRTLLEVFPNARAYLLHWSVDVPVLGLIGAEQWPSRADRVTDDPKISGGFIADPDALRRFSSNAPLNTDDHQVITYIAARFAYRHKANAYDGLLTVLGIEGPPTDFLKARNVYLQGLIHETEGRLPKAIEHYLESVGISDTFTMGYSRCISLAAAQAKERPEAARVLLQRLVEAKPREKLAGELLERLFPGQRK